MYYFKIFSREDKTILIINLQTYKRSVNKHNHKFRKFLKIANFCCKIYLIVYLIVI